MYIYIIDAVANLSSEANPGPIAADGNPPHTRCGQLPASSPATLLYSPLSLGRIKM